ncbi:MAG: TetR/AcrR family transcriptional regulator [Sporolactobacillus sp.]
MADGKQRIAEQSRIWLVDAFFELLREQSYEEITVRAIADRAQLSRRTFYRSFSTKQALLKYYGQNLFEEYLARLRLVDQLHFKNVLTIFFNFWWNKRDQLRLLIRQGLFFSLLNSASGHSEQIYEAFNVPWHIQGTEQEIKYVMQFATGGFWNVLFQWLTSDYPETPDQIVETIYKGIKSLGNGI